MMAGRLPACSGHFATLQAQFCTNVYILISLPSQYVVFTAVFEEHTDLQVVLYGAQKTATKLRILRSGL